MANVTSVGGSRIACPRLCLWAGIAFGLAWEPGSVAWAEPRLVQWNAAASEGASLVVPLAKPSTPGSTIVAAASWGFNRDDCEVSEKTRNLSYSLAVMTQGASDSGLQDAGSGLFFVGPVNAGQDAVQVELQCAGAIVTGSTQLFVLEYSGLTGPVTPATGSSGTTFYMATDALSLGPDTLLIGWARTAGGKPEVGTGFTERARLAGSLVEDQTARDGGAFQVTATTTSSGWILQAAAFAAAADGGVPGTEEAPSDTPIVGSIRLVQANAARTFVSPITVPLHRASRSEDTLVVGFVSEQLGCTVASNMKDIDFRMAAQSTPDSGTGKAFLSLFYATVRSSPGAPLEITGNCAGKTSMFVLEYAGLDPTEPLDGGFASAGAGVAMSSGPVKSYAPGGLMVALAQGENSVLDAGVGFNPRLLLAGDLMEDRGLGDAGEYQATATSDGQAWMMAAAVFRAAPPDGGHADVEGPARVYRAAPCGCSTGSNAALGLGLALLWALRRRGGAPLTPAGNTPGPPAR